MTKASEEVLEVKEGEVTVDHVHQHQEPSWYLMEGIPGQGDRPDFLEPKYKTMAEQAKAYKELQKALGATNGAPDDYDFGEYKESLIH